MRKRFGSVLVIGALALLGLAKPASAQIGGGLAFLTNDGTGLGFGVNAAKDHWAHGSFSFAPAGDFSFTSNSGNKATIYGGGIRANWHIMNARNLQPFGEFLAGGIHTSPDDSCTGCESDNAFQLTYGAGVHIPVTPKWNALVQFDIVTAMRESATDSGFRMIFGASVPWK